MTGGQDPQSVNPLQPKPTPVGGAAPRKPSSAPTSSTPATAANSGAGAQGKTLKPESAPASRGIVWVNVFTGWPIRVLLAMGTVSVWIWTITDPLPKTNSVAVVSAREELNTIRENIAQQSTYASVDESQLSNLVVRAQEYLIPKREKIVNLTASMEKFAREQGLQADIVIKPAPEKEAPSPGVRIFAGTLRLTPTTQRDNSPYERLLAFLDRLESITEKVEVVGLMGVGEKGRMGSAQVDLQFWIKHEKSASQ